MPYQKPQEGTIKRRLSHQQKGIQQLIIRAKKEHYIDSFSFRKIERKGRHCEGSCMLGHMSIFYVID